MKTLEILAPYFRIMQRVGAATVAGSYFFGSDDPKKIFATVLVILLLTPSAEFKS